MVRHRATGLEGFVKTPDHPAAAREPHNSGGQPDRSARGTEDLTYRGDERRNSRDIRPPSQMIEGHDRCGDEAAAQSGLFSKTVETEVQGDALQRIFMTRGYREWLIFRRPPAFPPVSTISVS